MRGICCSRRRQHDTTTSAEVIANAVDEVSFTAASLAIDKQAERLTIHGSMDDDVEDLDGSYQYASLSLTAI